MILSVIMPVYNEINTIQSIIDAVFAERTPKELIIVDDLSQDGTREFLQNLQDERIKIYFHDQNMGKGAAIRTALQHVSGDVVLIQDADLEYDPKEYPRLLQPILEGHADVVYGSRFLGGGAHRVVFYWHYLGNKLLTTLSNMTTNLNLTDMEVCYKVFKREVIQGIPLKENRFGFEVEITAKIARRKLKIYEVPISYYGRDYSEGKKIGWKDGFSALRCIVKYAFTD